jgi:alkyl hydroperoxide reductase subunit AhpC
MFPLLSDWKRKTVQDYCVYDEKSGKGVRATFVFDKKRKIQDVKIGETAIDQTVACQVCNLLTNKNKPQNP